MKRRTLLIPLIIVVVAAATAGFWVVYARETPRYALYQLKRALVARDMERAFLYIDLDNLTETMATAMFGTQESTGASKKGTNGPLRKDMLRELLPSLKKTFKEQAKDQLLAYIGDEKTIRSIDDTTVWAFEIDGHETTATVLLKKKPLFVMKKTPGGRWRITEIIFKKR